MTILAIDPGSTCGYAVRYPAGHFDSGVWELKGGRYEGGGMRFFRLRQRLIEVLEDTKPSIVVFEEVRRHLGTDAAHIYGGVIAVITEECEKRELPYRGIPVGTVKKYATGKGNSNKEAMINAAKEKWGELLSEDEADARWIAETANAEDSNSRGAKE